MSAMNKLFDKIKPAYKIIHHLNNGDIEIPPAGTKRYSNNVIHKDILSQAKIAAQRGRNKYENTGPWSNFELGMLNGKLSALRWVLGDEWDMPNT